MGIKNKVSKTKWKHAYDKKLCKLLDEYSRVLIAEVDNVGSTQLAAVRRGIRGKSEMLMGKNTLIRRCIKVHAEATGNDKIKSLIPLLKGNVGLIFTKADLKEVREEVAKYKVEAPARVGLVAPIDVVVTPGNTGLDPSQTSFFQVLNIPTKINKGTVEIVAPVDLIKKGDKVGSSEAALLAKLGIRPFSNGLVITNVYDDGSVFSPEVLDLTDEYLIEKFASAVTMVASLSLGVSYPTIAAAPHMFLNGYKNVLAVAVETDYSYPHADQIKEYIMCNEDTCAEPAVANISLCDLPVEILEKLLSQIPCRRDWARLRCVNKLLMEKLDSSKKRMQFPWLLLPSTTKPMYYSTDGQVLHRLRLPDIVRKANRIVGSHEGDWIMLADEMPDKMPTRQYHADAKDAEQRNRLYNLTTKQVIPLPDQMVYDGELADIEVITATLSGFPDSPDGCVVVAIVRPRHSPLVHAATCDLLTMEWEDLGHFGRNRFSEVGGYFPYDLDMLDIAHLDGSFYILTEDEEVISLVVNGNHQVQSGVGLNVKLREDLPEDKQLEEKGQTLWRYLVPLQSEILMVVRYIEGRLTMRFRVFKLEYGNEQPSWTEQQDLRGHKLFVGHGCSRAYDTGDEELCIYFYDDREDRLMMGQYYHRDDSGMANLLEIFQWPVFTEGSEPERVSERSPPAWWLHWAVPRG